MGADFISATQAKAQAETARTEIQRQLDTAKAEQQRLQAILAVKPLKEINTPRDLAATLESMQKADATRLPQDLPVHQILHEIDDLLRSMHSQKQTLEASFTKASSDKTIAEKDKVVFTVDTTKFENGELLFAHLSTHSPDKDSKKAFSTELLGLVHFRQQMLDKYVLPFLKDKLEAPNLGLTIKQANAPVTITIKTNSDKTQPVIMTVETKYLLKKHSDAKDPNGSAQISGVMTLTLHKSKYEGLVQRRIQNPDEKVTCVYKIDRLMYLDLQMPIFIDRHLY